MQNFKKPKLSRYIKRPWIYSFDLLGIEQKLNYEGHGTYSNSYSMTMTMLTSVSILILSIYFAIEVIGRSNYSVIYSQTTNSSNSIDLDQFPFMYKIIDINGFPFAESITYVLPTYFDFRAGNPIPIITPLKTERCNATKHFGNFSHLFESFPDLETFTCIVPGQVEMKLFGKYGDTKNGYSFLGNYINQCTNGSRANPNNITCATQEAIDQKLSSLVPYLLTVYLDANVIHSNQTHPVQPVVKTDMLPYPSMTMYRNDLLIRTGKYLSDDGFVFKDFVDIPFNKLGMTTSHVYIGSKFFFPSAYGILVFGLDSVVDVYERIYPKLQILTANIGGVANFLMIVGRILVYLINDQLMIAEFINKVIMFDDNDGNTKESNVSHSNQMIIKHSNILHKNSLGHHSLSSKVSFKNKTLGVNLSIKEILCGKNKVNKFRYDRGREIIKRVISSDLIFKLISDVENMKHLLLDENEQIAVNLLSRRSHKDFPQIKENSDIEVKKCLDNLEQADKYKKVMALLMKYLAV